MARKEGNVHPAEASVQPGQGKGQGPDGHGKKRCSGKKGFAEGLVRLLVGGLVGFLVVGFDGGHGQVVHAHHLGFFLGVVAAVEKPGQVVGEAAEDQARQGQHQGAKIETGHRIGDEAVGGDADGVEEFGHDSLVMRVGGP